MRRRRDTRRSHESAEHRRLDVREHEPELGAAPQHVLNGPGEFLGHQVAHLRFRERRAEGQPEVRRRPDVGENRFRPCTIGRNEPTRMWRGQERIVGHQFGRERRGAVDGEIAARQGRVSGPGPAERREKRRELFERRLGEAPVSRDLAAEDRQQRRAVRRRVELQHVVARRRLGVAHVIVMERTHAGKAPHDIGGRERPREIFRRRVAEIRNLLGGSGDPRRIAHIVAVGGADQRMGALVRDREHDAAVGVLKHVGVVVSEQLRHHDVGALDEAHTLARRDRRTRLGPKACCEHLLHPGACRIDERASRHRLAPATRHVFDDEFPIAVAPRRRHGPGARADGCATRGRIARIEHHEPRIVDPAIGKFETGMEHPWPERCAGRVAREVERAGRRQELAPAHVVVEEEPEPQQPCGPQAAARRQHDAQRPHDVGRGA